MVAACTRVVASSLRRMLLTWTPAVRGLMNNASSDLRVGLALAEQSHHVQLTVGQPEWAGGRRAGAEKRPLPPQDDVPHRNGRSATGRSFIARPSTVSRREPSFPPEH
jgi:hypothetical protein